MSFRGEQSEAEESRKELQIFLDSSLMLRMTAIIFSGFSLDRKDILVLVMHNLKTFLERVFESDFYSL